MAGAANAKTTREQATEMLALHICNRADGEPVTRRTHSPRSVSIPTGIGSSALSPASAKTVSNCANPAANDDKKFDFWFSTTADAQDEGSVRRKHFIEVEERARKLEAQSDGRLTLHFNDQVCIELPI